MKVGEEFDLNIEGHKVGRAKIVAVNADNTVELRFDAGRAVFQTKTYIEQAPATQGTEHALLGVEENLQTQGPDNIVDGTTGPGKVSADTGNIAAGAVTTERIGDSPAQPQPEAQPGPASPSAAPVTATTVDPDGTERTVQGTPVKEVGDTTVVQNEAVTPEVSNESD